MENKLLIQDLADVIASKEGLTKKKSEAFIKALFDTIEEGLTTDKFVKIKGLGTFKVITVGERESVNINTGERFSIEGHERITFTPDTMIKDLVNRPFAHFQTVVINDETDIDELENVEDEVNEPEETNTDTEDDTEDIAEEETNEKVSPDTQEETEAESENAPSANVNKLSSLLENAAAALPAKEQDGKKSEDVKEEAEHEGIVEENQDNTPNFKDLGGSSPEEEPSEKIIQEHPETPETTVGPEDEPAETPSASIPQNEHTEQDPLPEEAIRPEEKTNPLNQESASEAPPTETPTASAAFTPGEEDDDASKEPQGEQEQIRYIIKELDNKRNVWKTTSIVLLSLLLLILSYFAGYFRWFCPCELMQQFAPTQQTGAPPATVTEPEPQPQLVIQDSLSRHDSIPAENEIKKDTIVPKETVTQEAVKTQRLTAPKVATDKEKEVVKTTPKPQPKKKNTTPKVNPYRQVEGGKYEIIGTLGTHRIENGETIRTIALDVYGSKGYALYIIVHNNLTNPDYVDTGTVLQLPKLQRRK